MSARVARMARHMTLARASIIVFVVVALFTTLFMIKMSQGEAAPPANIPGVPHYFGPWPNWALSPLTLADAPVTIAGDGTGAAATATVGGNGAITAINVTNPGQGYTTATVSVGGSGTGAAATAVIANGGAVTAVTVGANGSHYSNPVVAFSGGGATTDATATAYGGVDSVTVTNAGTGYTAPTVDFDMPNDPNGTQAKGHVTTDANGAVTGIVIDTPGSGYSTAPGLAIHDGTVANPINNAGAGASATSTINVLSVGVDTVGAGYTSAPSVAVTDANGSGSGATATAAIDTGAISAINVTAPGTGYITAGGIKKFQDDLPGVCDPASAAGCPTAATAKFIPVAVPLEKVYAGIKADQYDIAVVQYRTNFNSSLPDTLARGYVQIETPAWVAANPGVSQHYPLVNEMVDGTSTPVLEGGQQVYSVTRPQWLGPMIAATKDKPVRLVFHNLLPTGAGGDLFIPTDSTFMGAGMGPMAMTPPVDNGSVLDGVRNPVCDQSPKPADCYKDNRQVLHLHGGITPWISDGTPHQWITPAGENTQWPQGVGVQGVPDMTEGTSPTDGIQTYYYTNQQSARLMFYHDHAYGITRLNVYVGGAAAYTITDNTEKKLVANNTIPGPADTIPLVVQDRTFVPQDSQLYDQKDAQGNVTSYGQDPTWDKARYGGYGNFWYSHVYMPAQNPADPTGLSSFGRWFYGPWFWPPATGIAYGPIDNPYYDPTCKLDVPSTWQYQTAPYCEPPQIPGTPNNSAGMEQFNDTPTVNGVAYPKVTLQPKTYRLRFLNAANDRFFNFQWYVADPTTGTLSEVALNPTELAAAQTDPNVVPTPDTSVSLPGPDWIQIGTEGGFLPAPAVINGHQPTTWITDPTRFDWGNVDKHSLLIAPAERADVIVDFSKFAGKTLILYNDAPAAFPGRIANYDYYTGAPDLTASGGAPTILPGYGPNTRTIMQVTIANAAPAPTFDLAKLQNAFSHKADGSGVFESSQNPIIVGQAKYNSAYGTGFAAGSNCNPVPNATNPGFQICDGFVRVADNVNFGFNTLKNQTTKTIMHLEPKALHDETNASTFDPYGRMQANLGVEAQPATSAGQNVTLYPYINPATEIINGTNLPKESVAYDANGDPVSDVSITPISSASDGTQIWRITHNGVDTHPIHFHLYDVQILNRVTWDNIIIPPDPNELGWKETVRTSPLEDTIVALRPIVPQIPFEIPNSIRNLSPMDVTGSTMGFNNIAPDGTGTNPITNQLVNYGWEYVWHCHILSHEEMDMMRPQSLVLPPIAPSGLTNTLQSAGGSQRRAVLTWNDNSITETSFDVQRSTNLGGTWTTITTIQSPLGSPNIHQTRTYTDPSSFNPTTTTRYYRVLANNTVGYVADTAFPQTTATSTSNTRVVGPSFNIIAGAGAGGTISPTGTVPVGRGGSQTFTIAPNASYRIATVLVDGVNNATAASTGTYTFTNVLAPHTISATFSQSTTTITASAGANGAISPSGTQTVAVGGSQVYTITPNPGYSRDQVLVDGVNDPAAVTSGTYTFTNVTTTHTISATFKSNVPSTITVTAPTGTSSQAQGSSLPVTWTTDVGVGSGEFSIWVVSPANGWYVGKIVAANGSASYSSNVTLNVPGGTGYRIFVYYRALSTDPWGVYGFSSGTVDVTAILSAITVTAPTGTSSQTMGATLPVTWTTDTAVATGEFSIWVVSPANGWYVGKIVAANGTASYADSVILDVPAATGYRIYVYYRATSADPWSIYGFSSGTVDVAGGITVTAPVASGSYLSGTSLPVTWTTGAATATGEYSIWIVSPANAWYLGKIVAANGTTSYADSVVLNMPAGAGYRVFVYYRATSTDPWGTYAIALGTVTIQ
jgi:FtsP/CotA-like multicopper oxidase with cupredoxin domain